jgi:hypothetical protein
MRIEFHYLWENTRKLLQNASDDFNNYENLEKKKKNKNKTQFRVQALACRVEGAA